MSLQVQKYIGILHEWKTHKFQEVNSGEVTVCCMCKQLREPAYMS